MLQGQRRVFGTYAMIEHEIASEYARKMWQRVQRPHPAFAKFRDFTINRKNREIAGTWPDPVFSPEGLESLHQLSRSLPDNGYCWVLILQSTATAITVCHGEREQVHILSYFIASSVLFSELLQQAEMQGVVMEDKIMDICAQPFGPA